MTDLKAMVGAILVGVGAGALLVLARVVLYMFRKQGPR